MPVEKKILERVEKMLRLAAPSSGATEPERISAALKAAELFAAHDLVIRERKMKRRVPPSPQPTPSWQTAWPPQPSTPPRTAPGWLFVTADFNKLCADEDCGEVVRRGNPAWMRINGGEIEYLHAEKTGKCGW